MYQRSAFGAYLGGTPGSQSCNLQLTSEPRIGNGTGLSVPFPKEELMRPLISKFVILGLALSAPAFATTRKHSQTTKTSSKSHHSSKLHRVTHVASWKHRGQQQIGGDRTREIQEALIREHYLDGTANGVWDNRTADALRKFQADQGWQSKVVPDSRALIKLGLGPSHENDLNPDLMGSRVPAPPRAVDSVNPDISQH
jgi:peptidoglycan hydrolase-like protein with peptidoglycan-binding domain